MNFSFFLIAKNCTGTTAVCSAVVQIEVLGAGLLQIDELGIVLLQADVFHVVVVVVVAT